MFFSRIKFIHEGSIVNITFLQITQDSAKYNIATAIIIAVRYLMRYIFLQQYQLRRYIAIIGRLSRLCITFAQDCASVLQPII